MCCLNTASEIKLATEKPPEAFHRLARIFSFNLVEARGTRGMDRNLPAQPTMCSLVSARMRTHVGEYPRNMQHMREQKTGINLERMNVSIALDKSG